MSKHRLSDIESQNQILTKTFKHEKQIINALYAMYELPNSTN